MRFMLNFNPLLKPRVQRFDLFSSFFFSFSEYSFLSSAVFFVSLNRLNRLLGRWNVHETGDSAAASGNRGIREGAKAAAIRR